MRWLRTGSPDPQGVRTVCLEYRDEGEVIIESYTIDPQGLGVEGAVKTDAEALGIVRMRAVGDTPWTNITDTVLTTYRKLLPVGDPFDVEVEVTVPAGAPREIPLELWWNVL